ncbi:hypothetical protein AQUCO_00900587v1 [Aquilegia coerulea]|uniref:SHSP domain-containing protein n=1 Tax=Aquilegia coerulea TaxID=218851 RepID=A0A2G5EEC5_AQUCA|nr:hypothetical protein AQUCO_00900587v1 [Aquilegia coerulea]
MAATRPLMTLPRSFEDFQPSSNLVQEEECETLILDVPGFRKDQIRVQMDDRSSMLIISGLRPIATNKWNRFRKDLHVPINCNTSEIQAKFENSVLRIIMPLKTFGKKQEQLTEKPKPVPTPPPPPPSQKLVTEPKPTPALPPPSQKAITEPKLPTLQPPPTHKSTTEPKLATPQAPPIQNLIAEPKPVSEVESTQTPLQRRKARKAFLDAETRENQVPEQAQHPLGPKPTPIPQGPLSPKPPVEVPLSQKRHTDVNDTPTDPKSTLRQKIGMKSKYDIGQDETTDQSHKFESSNTFKKHIDLKTGKSENDENNDHAENIVGIYQQYGGGRNVASTSHENQEKEKENRGAQQLKHEIKENVPHGAEAPKGSGAKKVAMELDDDSKQSIINMVAAVLVVVALWVYIKFTIKSPW